MYLVFTGTPGELPQEVRSTWSIPTFQKIFSQGAYTQNNMMPFGGKKLIHEQTAIFSVLKNDKPFLQMWSDYTIKCPC